MSSTVRDDRTTARPFARRLVAPALGLAAVVGLTATAMGAGIDARFDPNKVTTPPLRPIQKISPQRITLKNGMVVFLLEDHTLPVVTGIAYVKGSPTWIPDDKVGLGGITGQVMRSGGTKAHSGDWLDDRLASIGASVGTSFDGQELASSNFRCLSDNLAEVLGLWAEVVRVPAFPEDKLELAKVGLRRDIASRNDEMIPLLVRVARQAAYGKGSIWARQPEYATVEAVTRGDMVELHRKLFEPSRMVLAVYGDFQTADLTKRLNATLGDWKGAKVTIPPQPPVKNDGKPRLVFAPKDDVTQSGIILCRIGFRADDPDYPAMDVYQTALGGGFQSRLVNKIRSQRGLAYATGATAGEGYQRPGVFFAYSLTKSESTLTALELVREEVRRSVAEPFTDEEIRLAKNSVENAFVFNFAQPSDVLFRSAYYEVIGYPQDFLQRYQQGLQQVTSPSVTEAARRKVEPGQLIAVIVGKEKDFDKPLESAGLTVERVDITIPPPPSKAPKGQATGKSLEQGRGWLDKATELAGGSPAWRALKTLKLDQDATVTAQGQTVNANTSLYWEFPSRLLAVQKLPFGESKSGFDGTNGWTAWGKQVEDSPKLAEHARGEWERSLFRLFGHAEGLELRGADVPVVIDGVSYRVAYVTSDVVQDFKLFFAPDGWLARLEYMGDGPMGPARQTEILADWRPVGTVRYPYGRKVLIDGEPYLDAKVGGVWFDTTFDDATFKKPGS